MDQSLVGGFSLSYRLERDFDTGSLWPKIPGPCDLAAGWVISPEFTLMYISGNCQALASWLGA